MDRAVVLKKIACGILLLVSVFIIVSALYLYVNKDFIRDVDTYRLKINTYVSKTLGMKLESDKLEGGWHQFAPQFSVTNVTNCCTLKLHFILGRHIYWMLVLLIAFHHFSMYVS